MTAVIASRCGMKRWASPKKRIHNKGPSNVHAYVHVCWQFALELEFAIANVSRSGPLMISRLNFSSGSTPEKRKQAHI